MNHTILYRFVKRNPACLQKNLRRYNIAMSDILQPLGDQVEISEFYSPIPEGYCADDHKYVVVLGTVISGLGKGIFSSSLAKIFQGQGFSVTPIKLEGYLNRDSGTLNPQRHGEVFVLDDGTECDMDLGTYERMLNKDLSALNFATSGQILSTVIDKERQGDYLGRDVQMIPHVTGEVKLRLRTLAHESKAQIVFVEIGGTVGDVENAYYIEAVRELAFEERNVCFVALTYILEPQMLGEQKSKAAQLNLKQLMGTGIHPDIIACRASNPVGQKVREKIALYSNVHLDRVFSMHDCESVYLIPELIWKAGIDQTVLNQFNITPKDVVSHKRFKLPSAQNNVTIGIAGKYTSVRDSYASIAHALEHAGVENNVRVNIKWIDTEDLNIDYLDFVDGLIVPGGFGGRGVEGKIECIKFVRERRDFPFLGICYGMQLAVIEFARNVCGFKEANSTEIDPNTPHPVIDLLPEQRNIKSLGATMRLGGQNIVIHDRDSQACHLYGHQARLRFRHRYEVNPEYVPELEEHGMVFSGATPNGKIKQMMELKDRFFLGVQAHPELTSRPGDPDPLFNNLVKAAKSRHH